MPHSPSARLKHTLVFEWCVIKCGCKNIHQKDMRLKEIRLHAHRLLMILDSIVNIIGEVYMAI